MQVVQVTQFSTDSFAIEVTHPNTWLGLHKNQTLRISIYSSRLYDRNIILAIAYGPKPLSREYTGIISWTNSVICHVDVSDIFVAPIYDKLLQRME